MRNEVETVDIDGGQDQTRHEDDQCEGQAAEAIEGRLLRTQRQDQPLLILESKHNQSLFRQTFVEIFIQVKSL